MTFVVDASVAIKWVVREDGHDRALALVAGQPLLAPDFVMIEVANILWRKVRMGELDRGQAVAGFAFIGEAWTRLVPSAALLDRAFQLALDIDHPAYDCLYIACAQAEGATLLTDDRRLATTAQGVDGSRVMVLREPPL